MTDPATLAALAALWLLSLIAALVLARRNAVPRDQWQVAIDTADRLRVEHATVATQLALEQDRASRLGTVDASLDASREHVTRLTRELAEATTRADADRVHAAQALALMQDARTRMTAEFQALAHTITSQHSETFKTQNKEQVEALLTPLREKLTEFHTALSTTHTEAGKDRVTLGEQIRQLLEHGTSMRQETTQLTRALKGDVRQQGAWGELILEALLERSGLVHGEHYIRQGTVTSDEGHRLRPDITLYLSTDQHVVIDSKVSLKAFEAFVNAEEDAARQDHLGQHQTSVRRHIDGLAKKNYDTATGSRIGFVVMFVPIESALAAAMQADPGLAAYAYERNIGIATPVTLLMVLRTVHTVWRSEQRNTNAEQIADRAGKLYNKFCDFADDMVAVGRSLDSAKKSHDAAVARLSTGSGNLVGQAEKLRQLGAPAKKALPASLLEAAGEETSAA